MREHAYRSYGYRPSEMEHHYGANVHLLADPVLLTQLARLSRPETLQPEVNWLVRDLYESLVRVVMAAELPRREAEVRTRMFNANPNGVWRGSLLDPNTRVITVAIARAGTQPSQIAFEALTRLIDPSAVRQDHLYMSRTTGASGEVTGISVAGSKLGGDVGGAIVLFPDPMGATGGSMAEAASIYRALDGGPSAKLIAVNLIVTPEYLRTLRDRHPDMIVYALRLDRGLSEAKILKTPLGSHWDDECGLNERQYIVPGAGGLGEILNNSYV
ncbi:MAG: uracil phosphoribosyltransferase [Myxococcota bacterium]